MLKRETQGKTSFLPVKNLAAALLFAIFFGPLGLLYTSVWGGICMLFIAFIVLSSHFPVPIILMWISCSIWSVAATNRYNRKMMATWIEINHEEKNYSPSDSQ